MMLMNFPLSCLFLKLGFQPESTLIVAWGISICCLLLRLVFLRSMTGLPVMRYLRRVCLNVLLVTSAAAAIPVLLRVHMPDGTLRFLFVCFAAAVCSSLAIYYTGCTPRERLFLKSKAVALWHKCFRHDQNRR